MRSLGLASVEVLINDHLRALTTAGQCASAVVAYYLFMSTVHERTKARAVGALSNLLHLLHITLHKSQNAFNRGSHTLREREIGDAPA